MKKKNGFTLIELLAVIIILGILMIIAIPSVTSYINNSRKSAYVDSAKEIISGARNFVNEGKVPMYDTTATYYIKSSCISTENGQKSPYGDFVDDETYVIVTYDGKGYDYYWVSRDTTGQGVPTPTALKDLDEDDIKSDIALGTIIPTRISDDKSNVQLINSTCNGFEAASESGNGDKTISLNSLELGDYIFLVPDLNTYTLPGYSETGVTSTQTIRPSELTLWRVIAKNEDGTIDCVSEYVSSNYVRFGGLIGYSNFVGTLQTIAQSYAKEGFTKSVRMMGYDGQTLKVSMPSSFSCYNSAPSTDSTPFPLTGTGIEYNNGILGDTLYLKDYLLVSNVYKSEPSVYGSTGLRGYKPDGSTVDAYWLASRGYNYNGGDFSIYGHTIYWQSLETFDLSYFKAFNQNSCFDNSVNYDESIRPIITLFSNLKIDSGEGTKDSPYNLTK